MKRICAYILIFILLFSYTGCGKKETSDKPYEAIFTELGIPLKDYYKTGSIERCAWDVEIYEGELYVASGDYDTNKGPVNIWSYNLKDRTWKDRGGLEDEQIERFYIFDNKLYAPGSDSMGTWEYGNYYCYEDGTWITNNTLPGGVHNFDLIKFEGKLFAGLGVEPGNAPVVMSEDEKEWTPVHFYKKDKKINTQNQILIRVYDFFVLDHDLYAYLYLSSGSEVQRELYRFEDGKFVYYSKLPSEFEGKRNVYAHVNQKVEFNDRMYIAARNLYTTGDMKNAKLCNLDKKVVVTDLRVVKNKLYVLANESIIKDDGSEQFKISVFESKDGKNFNEKFYFYYAVPALSFTYGDNAFYFGMGYGVRAKKEYPENGMILEVRYRR
jgi:hypothetical protein